MGSNRTRSQMRREERDSRRNNGHDSSKGKSKFQEEREERAQTKELKPMSKKQADYLKALQDPDISVIIALGKAGSGKTILPVAYACLELLNNRVYKIALSRPAISNSKSLGYFSGPMAEKISLWLTPVLSVIKQYLGSGATEIAIRNEDITFYPLEIIKGLSLSSTDPNKRMYFIVDEAEDLTKDEIIKIVTRVGKNCTLVLAGDVTQSELKASSGLKWLAEFYQKYDLKGFYNVDFNSFEDIVRSDTVKNFLIALNREEKENNK